MATNSTRPTGAARGGNTTLGMFPTPGYRSPIRATPGGMAIADRAMNEGTAEWNALQGLVNPLQGGWQRAGFGSRRGRVAPEERQRINASIPNTRVSGLAELYALNARDRQGNWRLRTQFDQLQDAQAAQAAWDQGPQAGPVFNNNQMTDPALGPFGGGSRMFGGLASGAPLPLARGGPAKSFRPYLVNEEGVEAYQPDGGPPMLIAGGPQIFVPPADGKVIPHKKTMAMLGRQRGDNSPIPRANGGRVAAPAVNPFAVRWYEQGGSQATSSPGAYRPADSYDALYQQGQKAGFNMTNAPNTLSGLRRYLNMGFRQRQSIESARQAARASLAQSARENVRPEGPPSYLQYGTGSATFGQPRRVPGMARTDMGEWFPITSDPAVTNFEQATLMERRGRRTPGYSWEEVETLLSN